jgi:hypothetical protein
MAVVVDQRQIIDEHAAHALPSPCGLRHTSRTACLVLASPQQ